jgi:hypothetical protein
VSRTIASNWGHGCSAQVTERLYRPRCRSYAPIVVQCGGAATASRATGSARDGDARVSERGAVSASSNPPNVEQISRCARCALNSPAVRLSGANEKLKATTHCAGGLPTCLSRSNASGDRWRPVFAVLRSRGQKIALLSTVSPRVAQAARQSARSRGPSGQGPLTTTGSRALKSHKNSLLPANAWLKRPFEFISMV